MYPAGRVTKAQVIDYYLRVSSWLLPHLKDRPVTLKRYPNGVTGEYFYEKSAPVDWDELATAIDKADVESLYFGIAEAADATWQSNRRGAA